MKTCFKILVLIALLSTFTVLSALSFSFNRGADFPISLLNRTESRAPARVTQFDYQNGWQCQSRWYMDFDSEGNTTRIRFQEYDGINGIYTEIFWINISYNEFSLPLRAEYVYINNGLEVVSREQIISYEGSRPIQIDMHFYDAGPDFYLWTKTFDYNTEGILSSITGTAYNENMEIVNATQKHLILDDSGRPSEFLNKVWYNQEWLLVTKEVLDWLPQDQSSYQDFLRYSCFEWVEPNPSAGWGTNFKIQENLTLEYFNNNWYDKLRDDFAYDASMQVLSKESYARISNEWRRSYLHEYEWDANGNLIALESYRQDGQNLLADSRFEIEYLPLEVHDPHIPLAITHINIYPNPFAGEATILVTDKSGAPIELGIYNQKGQRVRILTDALKVKDGLQYKWDGRDDKGSMLSSGIYFMKLKSRSGSGGKKIILLK